MGQKVNPVGFRLGVIKDWDSRWYDNTEKIAGKIKEDSVIRNYVITRLKRQKAGVAKVVIERTSKMFDYTFMQQDRVLWLEEAVKKLIH